MLGPNVSVLIYKAQNARLILRNTTNRTKTARIRTMQKEEVKAKVEVDEKET
jgi:hypothetical protein